MNPIVGIRYKKRGEDYDLCEAEYSKLADAEKQAFERIDSPQARKQHDGQKESLERDRPAVCTGATGGLRRTDSEVVAAEFGVDRETARNMLDQGVVDPPAAPLQAPGHPCCHWCSTCHHDQCHS